MPVEQNDQLTERQRFWLRHLRACEVSGQTSIDYAKAHGLKVKSLYSARKALAGAWWPRASCLRNRFT